MQISQERKGQIALAILKNQMAHRKISLNQNDLEESFEGNFDEIAKKGFTKEELTGLIEEIIRENVELMFTKDAY